LFLRLLASVILFSAFANAQTAGTTPSDTQQNSPVAATAQSGTPDLAKTSEPAVERIGKGVSPPVPIKTPEAKYTREARKKKIEGVCIASVIVDAQGAPQNPKIIVPIGYGLDETAIAAIKKYRFKPAMKDGHPVAVQMKIEVNFRLY
jgi:TonB family protein